MWNTKSQFNQPRVSVIKSNVHNATENNTNM